MVSRSNIVAWNERGDPCDGFLKEGRALRVYFSEGGVVLDDAAGWSANSPFPEPTVAVMSCGELAYKCLNIHVVQAPRGVTCALVWSRDSWHEFVKHLLAGISIASDRKRIDRKDMVFVKSWLTGLCVEDHGLDERVVNAVRRVVEKIRIRQ